MVEPNTLSEQTMWSPALSSAMQVARIAAMPEPVPTQAAPPSIAASLSSKQRTVGLVKRE